MARTLIAIAATALVVLVVFLGLGPTPAQAVPGQKYNPHVNVPMATYPIRDVLIMRDGTVLLAVPPGTGRPVYANGGMRVPMHSTTTRVYAQTPDGQFMRIN